MVDPRLSHGWCSELKVGHDLCQRGYEIFFGFGHNSCDIVALKDGTVLRVEVKTAYIRDGKVAKAYIADPTKHDVLAVVTPWEIIYSGKAI